MNLKFTFSWILLISTYVVGLSQFHSIDGSLNNPLNPEWGAQGDVLRQITSNGYGDGISSLSGTSRPNPRYISNKMFAQSELIFDEQNHSDFVWVFGQFLDHDIVFVRDDQAESLAIDIPDGDAFFAPGGSPIMMARSALMTGTGTSIDNPGRYANSVTAYIDGSGIYGSDLERANWLRTFEGGKLKTSFGDLLPWNTPTGEFGGPVDRQAPEMDNPKGDKYMYVAGDARANENPLLLAFHTLFVREHNRICEDLAREHPDMTDEELYMEARRWVIAYVQKITYEDWLPAMGIQLVNYRGYREDVNPQVSNVFSAAAFRMGHTLINGNLIRLNAEGKDIPGGTISLRDAFFNPLAISLAGGIEPYLRGMASQVQQKMDLKVIDDVRNFLFGSPEAGGLDLAAININRGRERGLPDYNTIRKDLGLSSIKNFSEIASDVALTSHLQELYPSVDDIDPWVGMLAEDYMPGAMFGYTILTIIERQFQSLRDGDRFFYEAPGYFTESQLAKIQSTSFRDIIMRNTQIKIMQDNVFEAIIADQIVGGPQLEQVSLNAAAFPNPTFDATTIKVFADADLEISVTVYDNQGRRVMAFPAVLREGMNNIPLDISGSSGQMTYNVVLSKNEFEYSIVRVIKF